MNIATQGTQRAARAAVDDAAEHAVAQAADYSRRSIDERVASLDWPRIEDELDSFGCATVAGLLGPKECDRLAQLYKQDEVFRSRVVMERHGFGRGEYKYFAYPLPDLLSDLRTAVYPHLVPVANRWN